MRAVFVTVLVFVALFAGSAVSDNLNWCMTVDEYRFVRGLSYGTSPRATSDYDAGYDLITTSLDKELTSVRFYNTK